MVDGDAVQAFAQLEVDCLALFVDRPPATPAAELHPDTSQHQRSMGLVLEFVGGVDATLDRDIARRPIGERPGLGDRHHRRDGEDLSDAETHPERAQDDHPEGEREHADDDREEGSHGGDYSR